jgi:hypothetical protein
MVRRVSIGEISPDGGEATAAILLSSSGARFNRRAMYFVLCGAA